MKHKNSKHISFYTVEIFPRSESFRNEYQTIRKGKKNPEWCNMVRVNNELYFSKPDALKFAKLICVVASRVFVVTHFFDGTRKISEVRDSAQITRIKEG